MRKPILHLTAATLFTVMASRGAPLPTEAPAETLTVTLSAPKVMVGGDDKTGQTLSAPAWGVHAIPGEPVLPQRVFRIAIPPDAVVADVRFRTEPTTLQGRFSIKPADVILPSRELRDGELEKAATQWAAARDAVYQSDDFYPAEPARFCGEGSLRRYRFVSVAWFPCRFAPLSGRVELASQLTVEIDYVRSADVVPGADRSQGTADEEAERLLVNYADAHAWTHRDTGLSVEGSSDFTYLILCDPANASDADVLANWKRSIGYRVKTILLSDFTGDPLYTGFDLAGKIRAYLRDHYLSWGSQYLLIVGDHSRIPMRECVVTYANGTNHICYTDQYYGELSLADNLSWDADGNGIYGQSTGDNVDWTMELKVGRIPMNDPAGIQAYCVAARAFEMDTGAWKKRVLFNTALFDCTDLDDNPGVPFTDAAYIARTLVDGGTLFSSWTVRRGVEREGVEKSAQAYDFALSLANVEAEWNSTDYGLVNFAGHGDPRGPLRLIWHDDADGNGMASHGEYTKEFMFDRTRIAQVTGSEPSVVYFSGCNNGLWSDPHAIAKEALRGAAVATVSSSVDSFHYWAWTSLANGGGDQGMQVLWNQWIAGIYPKVGDALVAAKATYLSTYGLNAPTVVMLHIGNLYGDPALNLKGVASRPNLRQNWDLPGWSYPVVPRSNNGATTGLCQVTPTLPGGTTGTYLNYGVENNGSITAYDVTVALRVDGTDVYNWRDWSWIDPGLPGHRVNLGPYDVKGGRHTLSAAYDPADTVTESSESDNATTWQFVWSPEALGQTAPITRASAPPRGGLAIPNCDGYTTSNPVRSPWGAIAMLPTSGTGDHVLRLYQDYAGSTAGFNAFHVESDQVAGQSELVLFNTSAIGHSGPYYSGVFADSKGTSGYVLQHAASAAVPAPGTSGPFVIGPDSIVVLHHASLTAGHWQITARPSGHALEEIGMGVYGPDQTYASKLDTVEHGFSDIGGTIKSESCLIRVTTPGTYAIAVWKVWSSGLADATGYELILDDNPQPPPPRITRTECWMEPAYRMGVEWSVRAGWRYGVMYNSVPGDWKTISSTFYADDDGTCAWVDDGTQTGGAPKRMRFFRVYAFPP